MVSGTYELVAPIVFLGVVLVIVVVLIVVYKAIVNQSCTCLSDPGGREKAKKERKEKEGYDKVLSDDFESDDDEFYTPPTMTPDSADGKLLEEGTELVGPKTLSAYSAYSAYGDTFSLSQSYVTDHGLGRIGFDVNYAPDESRLEIHIIEGDSLPSKEQGGSRNFRIHLTLLPKKEQRFKSKSQSRYAPNFNESFVFENVAKKDLFTISVRFRLYSGTGKMIGETFFQLADIAKLDNPVIQSTWRAFRPVKKK